jgi:hypothetical protein
MFTYCFSGVNQEDTNGAEQNQNATGGICYPELPLFFTLSPLLVDALRKIAPRGESVANLNSIHGSLRRWVWF